MDIITLTLLFISLINGGLAALMIFRGLKNKANIFFFLTLIATFFWIFGLGMFRMSSFENGIYWATLYYVSASFGSTYFLYFALFFANKNIGKIKLLNHLFIHLPGIFTIIVLLANFHFIKDYTLEPWGKSIKLGPVYFFYATHIVGYFGYAIFTLIKRLISVSGIEKTQLKFIAFGTIVTIIFALVSNLFLPFYTYQFVWVGPYLSIIMFVAITYAITKHHLMGIKTITSEILVGLLLSILFINIFFYDNNLWFKIIIFLVAVLIGYFLIKSVFKEVRQREHIEKLMKMRSEFLDIASHQLKTPISVIMGTASMFKEGSIGKLPEEQQQKFVDNIYRKAVKLSGIVRDILSASEFDTEKFSLPEGRLEPVDLEKLLVKIKDDSKKEADEKGLELNFIKTKAKISPIISDEFYLTQAIANIVDNAIKYTKTGKIDIMLDEDKKKVILKIKDTGVGIPEGDKNRMFGKFERARNARDMYTDGSGLGLFISKEIIDAHSEASIKFNSKENEGTEFIITFQT